MKTIQFQLTVGLGDDASKALVELLDQALKQSTAPRLGELDVRREARLRASRNAIFAGEKPPEDQGLLLDTKETSKLLKISTRTIWEMENDGRMPQAVRIGKAVRWSYKALQKWVDDGCPARPKGGRGGAG